MLVSYGRAYLLIISRSVRIVGPDFWGLVNPEWVLCSKGKRQSPISIDATKLLFDPYLTQLHVDPNKVSTTAMSAVDFGI